jgi:hypothetical protein
MREAIDDSADLAPSTLAEVREIVKRPMTAELTVKSLSNAGTE